MDRLRSRLGVSHLESRVVPSTVAVVRSITHLHGHGTGHYTLDSVWSGAGPGYHLKGSVQVDGLGRFSLSGGLHGVGFIRAGHADGSFTLTNSRGSITLQLVGPKQPAFSALPSNLHFHVTGGTGAYRHAHADGTVHLGVTKPTAGAHPTGTSPWFGTFSVRF
jgi:hypothetical protein